MATRFVTMHDVPCAFFLQDTPLVARALLGKVLMSTAGGACAGGRIVETEAYLGQEDPGSHAATKGITQRNKVMFGPPGRLYVYFVYGAHHMVNLVTQPEGVAGAVLIRALEPLTGIEIMRCRRKKAADTVLTNGPGKVAQALGITLLHNDTALGQGGALALLQEDSPSPLGPVSVSGRIGLSAGSDLPLRFYLDGNPYHSERKNRRETI